MHIRGFNNGSLEAEIEVSRDYLEHLDDKYRRDATLELTTILNRYGIPYQINSNLPEWSVTLNPPPQLTSWKPAAFFATVIGLLLWIDQRNKNTR